MRHVSARRLPGLETGRPQLAVTLAAKRPVRSPRITDDPTGEQAKQDLAEVLADERVATHVRQPVAERVLAQHSPEGPGACRPQLPEVLLGSSKCDAAFGAGWGQAAPPIIFNGGDPSGSISQIHWTSWGGPVAFGYGLNPIFKPKGATTPDPERSRFGHPTSVGVRLAVHSSTRS